MKGSELYWTFKTSKRYNDIGEKKEATAAIQTVICFVLLCVLSMLFEGLPLWEKFVIIGVVALACLETYITFMSVGCLEYVLGILNIPLNGAMEYLRLFIPGGRDYFADKFAKVFLYNSLANENFWPVRDEETGSREVWRTSQNGNNLKRMVVIEKTGSAIQYLVVTPYGTYGGTLPGSEALLRKCRIKGGD